MALVLAAESVLDAAIYLAAAFDGRRWGALIALRWRDVDCAGPVIRVRALCRRRADDAEERFRPDGIPNVAETVARLGVRQSATPAASSTGSALRRWHKLA